MTPTDILRDEHRVILRALDVLERAAAHGAAAHVVDDAWWASLVDWLRTFADRTHHAKEEAALFPALVKAGVPGEGGPIAVMVEEHVESRRLVTAMAASSGAARREACRAYVALLRAHIDKENGVLFPLADAVLDEQAVQGLRGAFEAVEVEPETPSLAGAEAALDRLAAAVAAAA